MAFEAAIPEEADITKNQAQDVLEPMTVAFENNKLIQAGLSTEQLTTALKPVETSYSEVGEDNSIAVTIINMVAPMVFGLLLYFMLILYGQTVSKSVSTEKTSKLMDTLINVGSSLCVNYRKSSSSYLNGITAICYLDCCGFPWIVWRKMQLLIHFIQNIKIQWLRSLISLKTISEIRHSHYQH